MTKTLDMEQLDNVTGGVAVPPISAAPVVLAELAEKKEIFRLPVKKELAEEAGPRALIDEGVKLTEAIFVPSILHI